MGLTGAYNDPLQEQDGISVIKYAFSKGITFFDTADVYGANANELLVGKVQTVSFLLLFTVSVFSSLVNLLFLLFAVEILTHFN